MLGKLSEILGTIIRKKLGLLRAIASLGTKQSLVGVSIGVVTALAVSYWPKFELSKSKKEIRQKEQEKFFELEKAQKALHDAEEKKYTLTPSV